MDSPGRTVGVEQLVGEHYASLYRYAYRLTGSAADAEDLTQEVFCKAQAKQDQLRDPGAARAWLFTILRNAYLHRLRTDRRHLSLEEIGRHPRTASRSACRRWNPSGFSKRSNEMPEAFRTPVILYYFEEFSYRDIAGQMEVPLGTVMSRLARGKAFLRGRLLSPEVAAEPRRRATDGL